jgi:hypothetical protein
MTAIGDQLLRAGGAAPLLHQAPTGFDVHA